MGLCWGGLCRSICPLLLPGCGEGRTAAGGSRLPGAHGGSVPLSALAAGPRCAAAEAPRAPGASSRNSLGCRGSKPGDLFIYLNKAPYEHTVPLPGPARIQRRWLAACLPLGPPWLVSPSEQTVPRLARALAPGSCRCRQWSLSGLRRWQLRKRALQEGGHFQRRCRGEAEGMVQK